MRKGRAGNVDFKVYKTVSTHGGDTEQFAFVPRVWVK